MSLPSASNFRPVNPFISRILSGLGNKGVDFIAEAVLPSNGIVGLRAGDISQEMSRMSSGTIQRLGAASLFGDPNADAKSNRNAGSDFYRSRGFTLDPMTYQARKFDGETLMPLEKMADIQLGSGDGMDVKQAYAAELMALLKILQERYVAGIMFNAGNWNNAAGAAAWGAAGDDPIADLDAAIDAVEQRGSPVNTIVIGRDPARALRTSPGFREYLSYDSNRTYVEEEAVVRLLKDYFNVPNVFIGKARYNTDTDPTAAPTLADVWGDFAWVGNIDNSGTLMGSGGGMDIQLAPTAMGRIVVQDWTALEYDDYPHNSRVLQVQNRQWAGVVQQAAGQLITGI